MKYWEDYLAQVEEWQRGLDVRALVELVRDVREGRLDPASLDAIAEYERRLYQGLIPVAQRLPGRCLRHQTTRRKPRGCENCIVAEVHVRQIKFRAAPSVLN